MERHLLNPTMSLKLKRSPAVHELNLLQGWRQIVAQSAAVIRLERVQWGQRNEFHDDNDDNDNDD